MAIIAKIRRQGGAAVVSIPPALLKLLDLDVGGRVSLTVMDGALVARPTGAKARYCLGDLLEGADQMKQLNAETSWALDGDAVGREIS